MDISAISNNVEGNNSVLSQQIAQQIDRELTLLKEAINKSDSPSKYMLLIDGIERLYSQGNFIAARRKLTDAENMARDEGVLPDDVMPHTPQPINLDTSQNELQNTVTPNIPKPIVPTFGEKEPNNTQTQIKPLLPTSKGNSFAKIRVYQDASNDIGASFREPTPMNAMEANILVPAHEQGHLARAIAKALVNNQKIDSAYFVLNWQVDYASNSFYIAGGEATIQTGSQDNTNTATPMSKVDITA